MWQALKKVTDLNIFLRIITIGANLTLYFRLSFSITTEIQKLLQNAFFVLKSRRKTALFLFSGQEAAFLPLAQSPDVSKWLWL